MKRIISADCSPKDMKIVIVRIVCEDVKVKWV